MQDIAERVLHGPEFIFDGDVIIGLHRARVYRRHGERYHDACVDQFRSGLVIICDSIPLQNKTQIRQVRES